MQLIPVKQKGTKTVRYTVLTKTIHRMVTKNPKTSFINKTNQ